MSLEALAGRFGSPLYVYDLAEVRRACEALRASLPDPCEIYYSLKANPHPDVVATLAALGCPGEVSSPGELAAALAAGCDARSILYTGPGKSVAEVGRALRAGVELFSVDSPAQLALVAREAAAAERRVRVLLRVNPSGQAGSFGLSMGGGPSPFGADADWIRASPAEFRGDGWARVVGLHFYLGTNATDADALLATFAAAAECAADLAGALDLSMELLDLGGGFGHPFAAPGDRPDLRALRPRLEALLDDRLPGWRDGRPRIAFESGRYLVGAAGALVCSVEDVKQSGGRTFAVLDSGIHHLGGLGGLRRIVSSAIQVELLAGDRGGDGDGDGPTAPIDLVGPLCTPADAWARAARLPPLARGARLVVRNVGAYGLSASLVAFLGRDAPVEVVVDGARVSASRITLARTPIEEIPPGGAHDLALGE